jgi:glutamate/tyrosine decarboxylase-like PLP-dependent enzyme
MSLPALDAAHAAATRFLESLHDRPVGAIGPAATAEALRATLGGPLPERGEDPAAVVEALARNADPGIVASGGPRFFGFVVGGSLPAALGADWLTSAWDQNCGLFVLSPAASVVEETVARWLCEIFGLPADTGVGLVTGGQMASTTGLLAARHAVLKRVGWDVEERGLFGAPPIRVIAPEETHVVIYGALRTLGLGDRSVRKVACDGQGRVRPAALEAALREAPEQPTIVCAQAGNVNTGACDPLDAVADLAAEHGGAWVHVDGAFGLWAAASARHRDLVRGLERCDSWAVDAHKWLNVPYDSGIALVRDAGAQRAAIARNAAYLQRGAATERDNYEWSLEFSRRGRAVAIYAALRELGRSGLEELIDRSCACARRMAERLAAAPGVEVLNEVVLNQALVRFRPPGVAQPGEAEIDAHTRAVISRVQQGGDCWLSGTVWHGKAAMRLSVCSWRTTLDEAERSAAAIIAAHALRAG